MASSAGRDLAGGGKDPLKSGLRKQPRRESPAKAVGKQCDNPNAEGQANFLQKRLLRRRVTALSAKMHADMREAVGTGPKDGARVDRFGVV